jgi:hypothetical protein
MVQMKLERYKIRDLHILSDFTNNAQYMDIRNSVVIPKSTVLLYLHILD